MKMKFLIAYIILFVSYSCGHTRNIAAQNEVRDTVVAKSRLTESVEALTLSAAENSIFIIKKNLDLGGKTCIIPPNVTIKIKKGLIKNGILIGQNTKIEGRFPFFEKVTIKGDWIVPEINTKMFKNLNYDNSLRDIMALTNEKINNNVTIHKGVYYFNLSKNQETGIYIKSNTSVNLEGELRLKPNNYTSYHIVKLTGENCSLKGNGVIIGDKKTHIGTSGEWGMGVEFSKAKNAFLSDVTIKDCWGDCIYVGDESKNVTIKDCTLDNGRRQGISITSADSVWISDCVIRNVSGTNPQFAIDVEPNKNQKCTNINIHNVQSVNCVGGFVISGIAENAIAQGIKLSNCIVRGATSKYPLALYMANDITVENCDVDSDSEYSGLIEKTTTVYAHNNIFRAKGRKHLNLLGSKNLNVDNNQFVIKK